MAERSPGGPPADHDGAPRGVAVVLDVGGWDCLVVGAGPVGTRRALRLARAGARVRVVAPEATPELAAAAASGTLVWERRRLADGDLAGARLVVTATDDPATNRWAAERAGDGAVVSRADDADAGGVTFPATVRHGPLRVAVDTGGRVPALSRWVADALAASLDDVLGLDADGTDLLVGLLEEVRAGGTTVTPGPGDWRSALSRTMLDGVLLDLIRAGRRTEAKERLQACLSSS